MLLEDLAAELVDVTSELVEGRTINIMNPHGIIVASTEKDRIGSLHQGALEAVQTGKTVSIYRDQLSHYPGAKEGCNMPLRINGTIIGAVGIYGNPNEIQSLAHLLEVYATKYYQLEAMASPRLADAELRSRILRYLLSPSDNAITAATSLMHAQKIHLILPVTVVVISPRSGNPLTLTPDNPLPAFLDDFLLGQQDIWGIVNDRLVLILSTRESPLGTSLRNVATPGFLADYRISIGEECATLWDIPRSYGQASLLDTAAPDDFNDIRQPSTQCHYMLAHTATTEPGFMDELYRKLSNAFSAQEMQVMLHTAQCYYELDHKVNLAASRLFIHKNTLQYRVRRLLEALDLVHCTDFQQEYLVRLLLEHHKRIQGLRALE